MRPSSRWRTRSARMRCPRASTTGVVVLVRRLLVAVAVVGQFLGRRVERDRMAPRVPFDRYTGRLQHPPLLEYVAAALGADRVWSASQFNDYGACGFRFFAKRLLKREALEEPEAGPDILQLGTLNHAILEETYRDLAADGIAIEPDNVDDALEILHQHAAETLESAPRDFGFRAGALWEQQKAMLLRRLEALVRDDFLDSPLAKKFGPGPRIPYRQEAPFGLSGSPALEIALGDGESLRARGFIDRMDRLGDGVIVVDYKTGTTGISKRDMEEGRNFQMMLYLLAAEAILRREDPGLRVLGGAFWHIRNGEVKGAVEFDADHDEIEAARGHLARYIDRARQGDFAVQPNRPENGRCIRYCEFDQLCRIGITKGVPNNG